MPYNFNKNWSKTICSDLNVAATEGYCCHKESYFTCCTFGKCNFFCCNCIGECKPKDNCHTFKTAKNIFNDVITHFVRRTRSPQFNEAEIRFAKFDTNGDGVIRWTTRLKRIKLGKSQNSKRSHFTLMLFPQITPHTRDSMQFKYSILWSKQNQNVNKILVSDVR